MALEDTLAETNTLLKTLITMLQSAGAISAGTNALAETAAPTTTTSKPGRGKGAKDNSTNADPAASMGTVSGDPEGTRYWVSESLSTVYAEKPGDPVPGDASFKIETAAAYSAKKEEFAKKAAAAQSTGAAGTPATSTPGASTASSAPAWKDVLERIKDLNRSPVPGHGTDGVRALLTQFGLDGTEGKKVPALEGLKKHAEVLAFVNKMLTPVPAEDDLGL